MGNIINNHWARLVVLVAAAIQVGGSIEGFFWPKVTWDFATAFLNILVKPFPILQIVNLVLGITILAWEWPLGLLAGSMLHRSIHARLVAFAICIVTSIFLYQAHSSTIYYLLGIYGYTRALAAGEIVSPEPWTVPPVDGTPTLSKPYLDPEQGAHEQGAHEQGVQRLNLLHISEHSCESGSETNVESDSTRGLEYIPNLKRVSINQSPIGDCTAFN